MSCGCQVLKSPVTGFGIGGITGPCSGLTNQAAINACAANPSLFTPQVKALEHLYQETITDPSLAQTFTVSIPSYATSYFFKYVTESHCLAWYKPYLTGKKPIGSVFDRLNNWAIQWGSQFYNLPPAQIASPGLLINALLTGKLQISQWGAGKLIGWCVINGITPQSAFEYWVTPFIHGAEVLGVVAGIAVGTAAAAGAYSGAGAASATAATAGGSTAAATPIDTGAIAALHVGSGSLLTPLSGAGLTAAGGGILSTVGSVAGTAGTVLGVGGSALKTAAMIKAAGAQSGPQITQPLSATPLTAKKPSSIGGLLILGGAGLGLFALAHFL